MLGSRVMQDVTSRCETCPVIHLGKYPRRRVIQEVFSLFCTYYIHLGKYQHCQMTQEVFFLFCGKHLPTSKFIVISLFFITKPSSSSKSSPRVRWGPKIINSENLLLTPRRPYLTWQSRKRVDSIKRAQSLQGIGHWEEQVIITRRTFCMFGSLIEGQPKKLKSTHRVSVVW